MHNDHDLLRPQFHYFAPGRWINDPNGLLYSAGEYHLFAQTNPDAITWGNMSWGHAVSTDLVTWTHLEPALTPYPARQDDATTLIFSGSAVAIPNDAADGGGEELVAFYTAHERIGEEPLNESVATARSSDRGRSWRRDPGPVLDPGRRDFRDPKVFRCERTGRWCMVIADPIGRAVEMYSSPDGRRWERRSRFTGPARSSMIWECPDLVEVPVVGGGTRWVLIVSCGHPAGEPFTGMEYWVGTFDGDEFRPDGPSAVLDHGKDLYAAVTFNGLPSDRPPILLGWMSNWAYAAAVPTRSFRGAMSVPRELALRRRLDSFALVQRPVPALDAHLSPVDPTTELLAGDIRVELAITGEPGGVRLRSPSGDWIEVASDGRALWVDRRRSAHADFHQRFASVDSAPIERSGADVLDVRIVVDHGLVEVFADGGSVVVSELALPGAAWRVEPFGPVTRAQTRVFVSPVSNPGIGDPAA